MSEAFIYEREANQQSGSLLEQLRQELAVPLEEDLVSLHVPERPDITIVYDSRISYDVIKRVAEQAKDAQTKQIDALKNAALILASQCQRIEKGGQVVTDDEGKTLTFRSQAFIDATGAIGTTEALRAFFGRDTDIFGHYDRLADTSRFDREGKAADPTP